LAGLLGLVATVLGGFTYGFGDHVEQLPIVLRAMDPGYLAQDAFVNAGAAFGPRFYYAHLLAAIARLIPLPVVFFLLTAVANGGVAYVTLRATRLLSGGSTVTAMLAAVLVMSVRGFHLGGPSQLHAVVLTPSVLVLPLALGSLWAGIRRRPLQSATLAALATVIHPLVGLETGAIALATAGLQSERRGLGRVLGAGGLLAAVTLVVWVLPLSPTIRSEQFVALVAHLRHPHHYVPSTFGLTNYLLTLAFIAVTALSWRWYWLRPRSDRRLARALPMPILMVLLLCVGGYVFVELIPSRLWVTAQVFRMLFIVKWLGLVLLAVVIGDCVAHPARWPAGTVLLAGTGTAQPLLTLLGHAMLPMADRIRPKAWVPAGLAAMAMLVCFGSWRETMVLSAGLGLIGWFLWRRTATVRIAVPAVALIGLAVVVVAGEGFGTEPVASYTGRLRAVEPSSPARKAMEELARLARERTPPDAVFVVPPAAGRFRLAARRAVLVDFKSFPFQDEAMLAWKGRMDAAYGDTGAGGLEAVRRMDRRYRDITDRQLLELADRFGVTHALLYAESPCTFECVPRGPYKICAIPAGGAGP